MPPSPQCNYRREYILNDGVTRRIYVYVKPIDLGAKRYRGFLFPSLLPNSMLPKEFFAVPKWFPSDVEEAVEMCVNATVEALVEQIFWLEKDSLKPDRKKPWSSIVTRDPTNDDARERAEKASKIEAFYGLLELAREFEAIKPLKAKKPGPDPYYDRVMIVVAFVIKDYGPLESFKSLREFLIRHGLDFRVSDKAKHIVPSLTRLKELYQDDSIREWMKGFLKWLESVKGRPIAYYLGAEKMEYVTDSTKVTSRYLDVATVGAKKTLRRRTHTVKFLVNITTNMTVDVELSESRRITNFMAVIPRNATLYTDAEFFTEVNCEFALAKGIDFQVKPKKTAKRGIAIREIKAKFNPKRYKRRKNGERAAKPYSNDERPKIRFKNKKAIETMTIAIAIAKAYKRLMTLKAKQDLFKPIPTKPKTS